MKKNLKIDNTEYIFNGDDSFTNKKGEVFQYISLKKIIDYGEGKKHFNKTQTLTIRLHHWIEFRNWLMEIFEKSVEEEPF